MGPGLLKTFLGKSDEVNIANYVKNWKNEPNSYHIIHIIGDFYSVCDDIKDILVQMAFTHYIVDGMERDITCGGRHKIVFKKWETTLTKLKDTGCTLVFYSDLNLQERKINKWLERHNQKDKRYEEIYQKIGEEVKNVPAPSFYGMVEIAQKHGEFHYAVKYECDRELAMYANEKKAIAIISDDMDFCIFDGSWELWSCKEIDISQETVKTIRYNRKVFTEKYKLSSYQMSLLATLAGNDLINEKLLKGFHDKIKGNRINGIIAYVKNFHCNPSDIAQISQQVFGNKETQSLIRQSIESYNTNGQLPTVDDNFEKSLKIDMYRTYVSTKCTIQKLEMRFYDFSCDNFPDLLTEWLKRRMGLCSLLNGSGDRTFTLLTKKEKTECYKKYEETKIYPDFDVPGKVQLFLEADTAPLMEQKWEIFGWIMSLSKEEIFKIKSLKKKFWLTVTIVYIMVKNKLFGKEEADGVLYTEYCVENNKTANVKYPTVLVPEFVRAAHMYNVTFGHVRDCYYMAGLLSHIQRNFHFDGVFFQKHMEMNKTQRENLYEPIKKYRIYA